MCSETSLSTRIPRNLAAQVTAIIPARAESKSIAQVIASLAEIGVDRVIVSIDPRCTDATAQLAEQRGATVVRGTSAGYDGPCLAAIQHLRNDGYDGYVLFLDAGNKYHMDSIGDLLDHASPTADLTYGVRDLAMHWHQRLGNNLFKAALRLRFRVGIQDVSSVRLVRLRVLDQLRLVDRQYSLPFQTTVNALALGKTIAFHPIRCTAQRTGASKVSGSKANSARAAVQMAVSLVLIPKF
jgi:glycosyltransferase involved in cell wall biosynthesis